MKRTLIALIVHMVSTTIAPAVELWVIKDGVLNKEALTPQATEVAADHVGCGGDTVDGLYVVTPTHNRVANWARFTTAKSALGGADFGNIDAVVKRSEDNGKTWGPEIVVLDDGPNSINNQNPIVDPKTGRIWVWMHRGDAKVPRIYLAYSDDDGKSWSKPKDMTEMVGSQIKSGCPPATPWPASGIVLERGKRAGRLIMSANQRIVYSDDNGTTWRPGPNVNANPGESRCAELTDGSLLFIGGGGAPVDRAALIVTDGGDGNVTKQWEPKELVHVGCQGAVMRYSWPKEGKPGPEAPRRARRAHCMQATTTARPGRGRWSTIRAALVTVTSSLCPTVAWPSFSRRTARASWGS